MLKQARNLLFITTDQQRWDSLYCNGLEFMHTPGFNRLANEGMTFDRCYTTAPLCVPSRASLLTGCYPTAIGVLNNNDWMEEGHTVWPEILTREGFETCAIGKMHFYPWNAMMGFSERIIAEDKRHYYRQDDYTAFLRANGYDRYHPKDIPGYFEGMGAYISNMPTSCHIDSFIGAQAVKWLKDRSKSRRFAAWISFSGPHDPYDPPAEYADIYCDSPIPEPIGSRDELQSKPSAQRQSLNKLAEHPLFFLDHTYLTKEQIRKIRAYYLANITLIDHQIGMILDTLEANDLLEDTLIIFMSDHGDALGDHGLLYKNFFYESIVRLPLIIRGPGIPKGIRSSELVQHIDVIPLFLRVLGLNVPRDMQARDMSCLIDTPDKGYRDYVYSECGSQAMVCSKIHKYARYGTGEEEFYNLETDCEEITNLAESPKVHFDKEVLRNALLQYYLDSSFFRTVLRKRGCDPEYMDYLKNHGLI